MTLHLKIPAACQQDISVCIYRVVASHMSCWWLFLSHLCIRKSRDAPNRLDASRLPVKTTLIHIHGINTGLIRTHCAVFLNGDLPVVVGQLHVVPGHQDFAVLQPDEVRLGDALGHTGEHCTAPCWFGHRLRPLQELRRS